MSTTALEVDTPQLSATQLVARPGTLPTVTFPMTGRGSLVADVWSYLFEAADFFAVPMPARDELAAAIADFSASAELGAGPAAVTVTIAERDCTPVILVTGSAVTPVRQDAVRIADGDSMSPLHRRTDPWWRRMAARTTSRGDVDRVERWLKVRGFSDAVVQGVPLLGALVVSTGGEVVGIENPEPTSILDQLHGLGAITACGRADTWPADVDCAWWVSPAYETHPVAEVCGMNLPTDPGTRPPFTRWQ